MRANRILLPLILLFGCSAWDVAGQALFDKPVKVLGDPNFTGTAANPLLFDSTGPNWVEGREMFGPRGIALDNTVSPPIVYIADTQNNRVLAYQYATQLAAGSPADLILGQPDKYTNIPEGPGTTLSTGLNSPTGLAVDGSGNLYVADSGDNRVLRYPKPFAQPAGYQFPDLIIGQTSFASAGANTGGISAKTLFLAGGSIPLLHTGLAFDSAGNLWVTDTGNNRVLRFPAAVLVPNQNAPAADTVIGQQTFVTNTQAQSVQGTLTGLAFPTSVSFDSGGNMLVADSLHRVLQYPPDSTTNTPATRVLGVPLPNETEPTATGTGFVSSVIAAGSNVIVVDLGNNRVLSFSQVSEWPLSQTSPTANIVVGQPNFFSSMANQGGTPGSGTLSTPVDLAASSSELFVTDSGNNRVLVFPLNTPGPSGGASRVIGQLDFPYAAPNLVVGQEFFTVNGETTASGSAILDFSATPPHLYVADTYNNRVLGFNNFTSAVDGQKADIVIGQPDLLHTLVNYPSNVTTTPNNQGLNGPTGLAVDASGNLYVADTFNSRIIRFPAPFASGTTALEGADIVIGQENFNSVITDPTESTMAAPISLAFTKEALNPMGTGGYLVAVDASQNRVLLFEEPFSSGMNASVVLGQPDFTSSSPSGATTGLTSPRSVAVDPNDDIIVSDTGDARIAVFGPASTLTNDPAPSFLLTNGLNAPEGIGMGSMGDFWVADPTQNQLLHFASVDQLPLKNYTADATQKAVSPHSAFMDTYNNLLITDGIDRVLYFAPGLGVVNAANYLTGRALAPGTYAAIFPAVSTNVLASGTASAAAVPLPTVLAGTQVIVNGTAAPLNYVSPGQINFELPMEVPTGGIVNLQVVSQATGEIYGGAEIPLSSASPALFTIGATGTGQVAAINDVDSSINSATNPVVRGQYITLLGTGQGPVANAPPDGQVATGPVPTAVNPQILLGGAYVPAANIQYSGLAPDLVGVWQINLLVPTTVTAGNAVPIIVLMNSIPSDNPASPSQIATTIALK